jgi:hypothetical protein
MNCVRGARIPRTSFQGGRHELAWKVASQVAYIMMPAAVDHQDVAARSPRRNESVAGVVLRFLFVLCWGCDGTYICLTHFSGSVCHIAPHRPNQPVEAGLARSHQGILLPASHEDHHHAVITMSWASWLLKKAGARIFCACFLRLMPPTALPFAQVDVFTRAAFKVRVFLWALN